jgi:ATP-dependent helicase/nuclease subunit A
VGVVAHRLLEEWEFAFPPSELLARIAPTLQCFISPEHDADLRSKASDSLTEIFATFGASEAYARLKSAAILGREIPFLIPWDEGQVMEGVIDLIYRLDGKIWIADYKTGPAPGTESPPATALHARQAAIYRQAARRCLKLSEVCFQLVFLRTGLCMEL